MIRNAVPVTFLAALALALPVTAAAQGSPAPTISKPTLSASGTIATNVTLPDGGLYAQQFFSGRVLLCRAVRYKRTAGTFPVACRIRSAALTKLRQSGQVKLRSSSKATVSRSVRIVAADFPVQVSGALLTDAGLVLASQRGSDSAIYPADGSFFGT